MSKFVIIPMAIIVVITFGIVMMVDNNADEAKPESSTSQQETSVPNNESIAAEVETVTLKSVGNYAGDGTATRTTEGKFTHELVANVGDPAEGKFYEGWLVGSSIESTGELQKESDGVYSLVFTTDKDLSGHDTIVVTEETVADGLDGKPEAHVLEGSF